jgi:hypothetical protein
VTGEYRGRPRKWFPSSLSSRNPRQRDPEPSPTHKLDRASDVFPADPRTLEKSAYPEKPIQ